MRIVVAVLFGLMGLGLLSYAQTQAPASVPAQGATAVRKSPLAGYAGTWTGSLDGKPWLAVRLIQQGQQLTGSLQRPTTMQFADSGDVKSVSDEQLVEPLTEAVVNPDGLLLSVKNQQTQQTDRYTMRLTGENTAELKMSAMSMPPGMPKLKPWKLTKAGVPAPTATAAPVSR